LARWAKPRKAPPSSTEARPARPAAMVIPQIDGVDVRDGLKRAAGNRRLYRDLLIRFAKDNLDAGTQIAAALERGDPKQAAHIAHTVKGVAGNLSIRKIYSSADKLEKAIRERDSAVPKLLSAFTSVVKHQVHAIQHALPDAAPHRAGSKADRRFDPQKATSAAGRLRELLDASDGDSAEAFSAFTEATAEVVDKPRLDALGAAINKFDFESALQKLSEIERLYIHGG
jgi:two-component system sensor histidine kinase/response regulator